MNLLGFEHACFGQTPFIVGKNERRCLNLFHSIKNKVYQCELERFEGGPVSAGLISLVSKRGLKRASSIWPRPADLLE